MKDKQKRLLELFDYLKLPMTPEEVREHVEKLSDEEIDILTKKLEAVKKYQDEIELAAKKEDPDKYEKLRREHEEKAVKLEENHLREMEEIQKKEDEELDQIEEKARKELNEAVEPHQEDARGLVEASGEIVSGVNSIVSEN